MMSMYFNSWSGFWVMEGHGLYVWSAYGIAAVVIAYNLIAPLMAKRQILAQIAAQVRRQERLVKKKVVVDDFKTTADGGADAKKRVANPASTQLKHLKYRPKRQEEGLESVRPGERSDR